MIFADTARVKAKAGDGGNGMTSFRREPYVDRGGPDGGDGGRGGNVVFEAVQNLNTLARFRHNQLLQAEPGGNGARAKRHGKNGEDLIVEVPVGTVVLDNDEQIADLNEVGMQCIAAKGGDGGFGNAHFTSSTRQAPNFSEVGEKGDERELALELKMIADVGLVGLPNAGKSTFLSVVSNAKPAIADYPFTTLVPNLGVADVGDHSLLIADIPGLIEGASKGKGLGDDFLRHVERTAVLIHLIDIYSNDVASDFRTIQKELREYKVDLTNREMVVALTKAENVDEDIVADQKAQLLKASGSLEVFIISSQAKQGINELLQVVDALVQRYRQTNEQAPAEQKVVTLDDDVKAWELKEIDGEIHITGKKIEKFAARTDTANEQAVQRLKDIMRKMGIERELKRRKVDAGTTLVIGKRDKIRVTF